MNLVEKLFVASYLLALFVLSGFMVNYYFDEIRKSVKKSDGSKDLQNMKRHIYMNGLCLYFVLFVLFGILLFRIELFW